MCEILYKSEQEKGDNICIEEKLLQCVAFDQDAFRDLRIIAAEERQKDWDNKFLRELQECSWFEFIYSRRELPDRTDNSAKILKHLHIDNIVLLGSSMDGLYLEKGFPVVDTNSGAVNETDLDVIFEFKGIDILQRMPEDVNFPYLLVKESKFPGYVLLQILSCRQNEDKAPEYFEPKALQTHLALTLQSSRFCVFNFLNASHGESFLPKGPALSGACEDELGIHQLDYVVVLTMADWPNIANSFLFRQRPSGWPTREMIQELKKLGCGFVAAGHEESPMKELEWRVSFSVLEKRLLRELSEAQLRSYLFFKSMYKLLLLEPKCLTSYMMKNILLWVIETVPLDTWRFDNILQCVLALVDKLAQCLQTRTIPNYFVPKRNMIGHIKHNIVKEVYKKVWIIQNNVLGTILSCSEMGQFMAIHDTSLKTLYQTWSGFPLDKTKMILSALHYIMYLNLRLHARRYHIKLSFNTLVACLRKNCRSLFSSVCPKSAWYLIQAIKLLPDASLVRLCTEDSHYVLHTLGMRVQVMQVVTSELYQGFLKKVISDQEFVTNEQVIAIPEFNTLVDWVDMTSVWSGGQPLSSDHIKTPIQLD
ncbi:hypothetical protein CHS0354_028753 [Potamilus streckersoni]|uniref:Mab-21-like HhH/H2TH-like domain-containing protein n=1 Tax=Potamilus streckersoni TaxID=2493646 RepID=A0AAE0S9N7_9BIVA|nr:hypothetical protein CHS0354_028753 [Potamilus streckersoni]